MARMLEIRPIKHIHCLLVGIFHTWELLTNLDPWWSLFIAIKRAPRRNSLAVQCLEARRSVLHQRLWS